MYKDQWVFVASSASNNLITICFALYTDVSLTCATIAPLSPIITWGTVGGQIYFGDLFLGSIVGKETDCRYYSTSLSQAELTTLFTQRKAVCIPHCLTCSDIVTCTQCVSGWYLSGSNTCISCNPCCGACTGAGDTACTSCAPLCVSTGPNTCTSKR